LNIEAKLIYEVRGSKYEKEDKTWMFEKEWTEEENKTRRVGKRGK
jgi:hypothetical protein